MKKVEKIIRSLRAANPGSKPRNHAYSGHGSWLYWHTPSGESILIGVTITLNNINYRQLAEPTEVEATATTLWGCTVAWQLSKLLHATAVALHDRRALPDGISSEAIPFCNGDNPTQILDRLWRHGPAQSILLKKKPPSELAERSSGGNNLATEPEEEEMRTPGEPHSITEPAARGAKNP